ncbi:hypothetical protein ACEPUX_31215, partial [Burkholderia pseudomallei]
PPPKDAAAQWAVTLALCAFLIVPVAMSVLAGLTVNYFRGPAAAAGRARAAASFGGGVMGVRNAM